MKLRIIGGELGGRFIETPPGRGTRPTANRVREAWFSALADRWEGAWVVDLFAGSGALGIEALSRGAARVHFVDSDSRAIAVLKRNLEELDLTECSRVSRKDVFAFLRNLRVPRGCFDIALADPPYGARAAGQLTRLFRDEPFARLLCLERGGSEELEDRCNVVWERRYADTVLTFLGADPSQGMRPYSDRGLAPGVSLKESTDPP